jgi:hypothetical protein
MNNLNQPNNISNGLSVVSDNPIVVCQDALLLSVLDFGCCIDTHSNLPEFPGMQTTIYKLYPVINGDSHLSLIQIWLGGKIF